MKRKIITLFIFMISILLVLPFILIQIVKPHEFMGVMIFLFFIINPIASAIINSIIGIDIKKLWWMPLLYSIIFLISYWLVLGEIILDLIFYAIIYLIIGIIFMVCSNFIIKKIKN